MSLRRVLGGAPHAGMGGQGAVVAAQRLEAVADEVEVLGLLVGGLHPVVIEPERHGDVGEARDDVPVQVDGVQLDVGDRMQKGDPSLGRARPAARNFARRQKRRTLRPRRPVGRAGPPDGKRRARRAGRAPGLGMGARAGGLLPPVRGGQDVDGKLGEGRRHSERLDRRQHLFGMPGHLHLAPGAAPPCRCRR